MHDIATITWLAWAGTVVAFLVGVYQYADKKAQANREPFLREQFKLCFQASSAAARMTTESDPVRWDEARREFWILFYGPLCIVENREVAVAMIELSKIIPKPEVPLPQVLPLTDPNLRAKSINLAHAARHLIQAGWGIKHGSLGPENGLAGD